MGTFPARSNKAMLPSHLSTEQACFSWPVYCHVFHILVGFVVILQFKMSPNILLSVSLVQEAWKYVLGKLCSGMSF
jgi:hypothetical protein